MNGVLGEANGQGANGKGASGQAANEILDTLEGVLEGSKGQGAAGATKKATVTIEAAARSGKTVTVGQQASSGSGNIQFSFVTLTVFGTGSAPTVTVTPLPQMVTQEVTVTVTGDCAATSVPPGISMPNAAGTGGTAGAAQPSNVASVTRKIFYLSANQNTNILQAAAVGGEPAVGSPGAMALGTGTILANGACDCSCLCGYGSFSMATSVEPPAAASATTLSTVISSPLFTLNTATSFPAATDLPSAAPSAASASNDLSTTTSSSGSANVGLSTASPAPSAQAESPSPSSSSMASTSSSGPAGPQSVTTSAVPTTMSGASTLELSVTAAAADGQAALAQPSSDPINISTFSLTSSLILGSLAQASVPV